MSKKISVAAFGIFGLSALVYFYAACISGGTLLGLSLYILAFVFCIILCGKAISEYLVPHITGTGSFVVGFVFGTLFTFLSFILFSLMGLKELCLIPPLCIGVFYLYLSRHKLRKISLSIKPAHIVLLLTGAAFLILYTICVLLPFARADKLGNFYYHQDMLWSVGNAASVYNGFPLVDMRFSAATLNYHYLNDVIAGIIGLGTLNPAYQSLCFYYYPIVGLCLIVALYLVAKGFCSNSFLASLFPVMVLWANGFNGDSSYHFLSNINGLGGATLALCAGFLLVAQLPCAKPSISSLQNKSISKAKVTAYAKYFIAAVAVGFGLSMFKSTIGALFILSIASAFIVGFFAKKSKAAHFIALVGLSAGFCVAYFFIFSKAINNLIFNGFSTLIDMPRILCEYAPLALIFYLPTLVFSVINFKKLSFLQLTAHALAIGGIIAFALYYHYSASQVYFLLAAIPMVWLSCLDLIDKIFFTKKQLSVAFTVLLIIGCVPSAFRLAPYARTGVQALLRVYNLRHYDYDESYITTNDYNAMVWLRDNTLQSSIFATNRNNKVFAAAEGTFHYYSAVSQRRAYLESYRYCMDYSGMYHEVRRRLEQVSDNVFQAYDEKTAFDTARAEHIDYLVVFLPLEHTTWSQSPVYENATVKIYKVDR